MWGRGWARTLILIAGAILLAIGLGGASGFPSRPVGRAHGLFGAGPDGGYQSYLPLVGLSDWMEATPTATPTMSQPMATSPSTAIPPTATFPATDTPVGTATAIATTSATVVSPTATSPAPSPTWTRTPEPTGSVAPLPSATPTPQPTFTATPTATVAATATAIPTPAHVMLAAGSDHTCAVTGDGAVRCWGASLYGQVGDGTSGEGTVTPRRVIPADVMSGDMRLTGVQAVTAGEAHSCALLTDGRVMCWGSNATGQLGVDGGDEFCANTPCHLSAVAVQGAAGDLSSVTGLAAGYGHTCALIDAGAVLCWGLNQAGQLGDGTTTDRVLPGLVDGLDGGVRAVVAGAGGPPGHTCALMENGTARCWGDNTYGQLGAGHALAVSVPVTVTDGEGPLSGIVGLAMGADYGAGHTCALLNDGGVYCWGRAAEGQIGDGTTGQGGVRLIATAVYGLSGVRAITAGHRHTCALTTVGMACWGQAGDGQLGDGSTGDASFVRLLPVNVAGVAGSVIMAAGGRAHTCALLVDERLQCWGNNLAGQLGNGGEGGESLVPVDVAWP